MEFLGLPKATWEFINTFADWLAGLGTLAAVITSLYLACASRRIRLHVTVGHKTVIEPLYSGPLPEYISIEVTNMGPRVVYITGLEWRGGILRTIEGSQVPPNNDLSSPIPVKVADSQQVRWMIPLDSDGNFISNFAQIFLTPWLWRIQLRAMRVYVLTSTGGGSPWYPTWSWCQIRIGKALSSLPKDWPVNFQ